MSQVNATIFAGVEYAGDGSHHTAEQQTALIAQIEQAIVDIADGCTLQHTIGSWKSPEGEIVREKAIRIDVLVQDYSTGRMIAGFVKRTLNQYSVLLELVDVKGEFV